MSLTGQQIQAAAYIAADELSDRQIGEKLGVTTRTLRNWKGNPEFSAEIESLRAASREVALKVAIADRVERLARLNKRWIQIDKVITERGADRKHQTVPGFSTGILCHEEKSVGGGDGAQIVDVFRADTALLKEERELGKQAAIEMGQWQEKTDVTSGGNPLDVQQVVIYLPSNGRDPTPGGTPGSVP